MLAVLCWWVRGASDSCMRHATVVELGYRALDLEKNQMIPSQIIRLSLESLLTEPSERQHLGETEGGFLRERVGEICQIIHPFCKLDKF